jgi:hypothetical protein
MNEQEDVVEDEEVVQEQEDLGDEEAGSAGPSSVGGTRHVEEGAKTHPHSEYLFVST